MAPRGSSPTSLLWAHQLKREHAHLLKRIQDQESNTERQAKRLKTVEDTKRTSADVATLAKQVKALDSTGANERLTKMEQSTQRKFEDMEADSEAMTMQIAAMQQDNEDREDEKKAAFKNEKALIKRIAEMEAALKTYEQSMGLLDKRISEAQLDQIKAQLETVTERLAREGPQMKDLAKNVNAFGVGIAHLQEEIEKMRPELEALATKQAAAVAAVEPEDDATAGASTEIAPPKKKAKKSHKWGGSGADREVVSMGAEAFNLPVKDPTAQDDEGGENDIENEIIVSKPPTLKPKGKKPKPIPPHLRKVDPSAPKKKSHKWSGGGADAAVIHSGILPADEVAATPATTAASHNEKIVRSNRFWVEYASSPVDEDERTGVRSRPRAGPPKRIDTPHWTAEEAATQGRVTRRKIQQVKTEPTADENEPKLSARKSAAPTKVAKPKATTKAVPASKRRSEPNIITSPRSSPPLQPQTAPRQRRRIVQADGI